MIIAALAAVSALLTPVSDGAAGGDVWKECLWSKARAMDDGSSAEAVGDRVARACEDAYASQIGLDQADPSVRARVLAQTRATQHDAGVMVVNALRSNGGRRPPD
jgi:hypothetical protein